ncbi:MAG: rhomboid family intramembrane serine protease [Bacteroidota bacterium]|nr:rhomboid family intramembrane serine protease [Bacteroidota bacterium]
MYLTITFGIILITCIISWVSFNNYNLKSKLILSPSRVLNQKEIWLLFTHAFIHADFLHLFFNMYVLYMFGPYLEIYFNNHAALGEFTFLIFYVSAAMFATIPSLYKHGNNPNYLSLGASGAVSAIVFSYIVLNPLKELGIVLLPGIWIPGFIFGVLYILAENYMAKKKYTNIAHDAHICGSIFGILFIMFFDFNNAKYFFEAITNYAFNYFN